MAPRASYESYNNQFEYYATWCHETSPSFQEQLFRSKETNLFGVDGEDGLASDGGLLEAVASQDEVGEPLVAAFLKMFRMNIWSVAVINVSPL